MVFAPKRIYMVGLPASGKSKVGALLAKVLGVPHWDTDKLVEEAAGVDVPTLFQTQGEEAFRRLEADAVRRSLELDGVISLGGGAVETPAVREILADQPVVWIEAALSELLRRVTRHQNRRPLLAADPEESLQRLSARRAPLFTEVATIRVTSTEGPHMLVVNQILQQWWNIQAVLVEVADPYPVIVGDGASEFLAAHLPPEVTKCMVMAPASMQGAAHQVADRLRAQGLETVFFFHEDGEGAKCYQRAIDGWNALGQARLTRKDLVVTVGGGVSSDLGGFLAATWLRGIKVAHVSTTLLGMVDAAVGGKTGIDTPTGKNLVGAFHDPIVVAADTAMLRTLPQAEYAAGMAETIKAGFIKDTAILSAITQHPGVLRIAQVNESEALQDNLRNIVTRAIQVKASVVGEDKFEAGLREILNYGHTLGHAIERAEHYGIRHGEGVAIGCVFAAELARHLGMLTDSDVELHRELFSTAGLPTSYAGAWSVLLEGMYADKKTRAEGLRFVLLNGIGKAMVRPVATEDLVQVAPLVGIDVSR